jgi:hypothetical protein
MFTVLLLSGSLAANAPAPTKPSVSALVKQLSSADAARRDRAAAQLWDEIERALPQLLKARRGGDDTARQEVLKLLVRYYAEKVRVAGRGRTHGVPWLDMLPPDYPERDVILRKYVPRAGGGQAGTGWENYRQATIFFLAEMMAEEGWDSGRVRHCMERMAAVEYQWCREHNYTYPPLARGF